MQTDARIFVARLDEGAYDLCLADPPYTSALARSLMIRDHSRSKSIRS